MLEAQDETPATPGVQITDDGFPVQALFAIDRSAYNTTWTVRKEV